MTRVLMGLYGELAFDARVRRAAEAVAELADLTVLALGQGELRHDGFVERRVDIGGAPGPLRFVNFCRAFWRTADAMRPDVVYAHDYFLAWPGLRAARRVDARFVYDAHELMIPMAGFRLRPREYGFYRLERTAVRGADLIVAATPERAAAMAAHYDLPAVPTVVRNIEPLPECAPDAGAALARYPALAAPAGIGCTLLYAGVVSAERRLDLFVRALAQGPSDVRLVVVGGGPAADDVAAQARQHGVAGRVVLLGQVPHRDLHDIFALADIGLVNYASDSANTLYPAPNKVFEYAHAGLPVLASAQPPLLDLVQAAGIGACFDYVRAGDDEDRAVASVVAKVAALRADATRCRTAMPTLLSRHGWAAECDRLRTALAPLLR